MSSRTTIALLTVLCAAAAVFAAGPALVATPDNDAPETASPAFAEGASEPVDMACDEASALDYTPAREVRPTESLFDGLGNNATAVSSCSHCSDRPWCKCKYNGLPRVSCNPCCYGNLGIPQTCLD